MRHQGNTVLIHHLVVGVGQHLEGKAILRAPHAMAVHGIERDTQHNGVQGLILGQIALKVVRFQGASLRLVLGVEVQHNPLALVRV